MTIKYEIKKAKSKKPIVRQVSDHWRDDLRCYASQWGFRYGSEIAKLIDYIRDEYRAKYGTDYRLRRLGKNRFIAVSGDCSDYGVSYAVEAAKKFQTSVTCGTIKTAHDESTK